MAKSGPPKKLPAGKAALPARSYGLAAELLVAGGLFVLVLALFYPATANNFVNLDDDLYVYHNAQVQKGLTWEGVGWAFQTGAANNWHPLTWLSLMLDVQLFGPGPVGLHLTNVLLHAVNTLLLFLLLNRLTRFRAESSVGAAVSPAGIRWSNAFIAMIFGVHPLHVESVAWVSERKDVLSGFFFLLTLLCYTRYVVSDTRPATRAGSVAAAPPGNCLPGRSLGAKAGHWSPFYWLALLFFALGLMCKPMLVTVPFVLLLLDYWPLRRFEILTPWRLALEKTPFLAISALSCVATVLAQGNAIKSMSALPLNLRLGNALNSYVIYLAQMVWPARLAAFYPIHRDPPAWQAAGAGFLLLFITALAVRARRRFPCMLAGWLWYLGMLVPVIGLIQVGDQSHADRYTYLPQIGLYLAIVWGIRDLSCSGRWRRPTLAVAAAGVAIALAACTRNQIACWRDGESLWNHALACTTGNYFAHYNLGFALASEGRAGDALEQYQRAIAIKPNFARAHIDLGILLYQQGRIAEAVEHFQEAIKLKPNDTEAYNNLGILRVQQGRAAEAIANFQTALKLDPAFARAHFNLALAFVANGQTNDAIAELQAGLKQIPNNAPALCYLGTLLNKQGRSAEAVQPFEAALKVEPDNADAQCGLGIALVSTGRLDDAIDHLREALRLKPDMRKAQTYLSNALSLMPGKAPLISTNASPAR